MRSKGKNNSPQVSGTVEKKSKKGNRFPPTLTAGVAGFASGMLASRGITLIFGSSTNEKKGEDDRKVKDVMTKNPALCTPETPLTTVAKMMLEYDCGALPVVDNETSCLPLGLITDRDIVIRGVTLEEPIDTLKAGNCMTHQTITIETEASLQEAMELMEEHRVRRLIVVDADGKCVGILVQAQIARTSPEESVGDLVREISQPGPARPTVAA